MGLEEGFNVQSRYVRSQIQNKSAVGEATEEMVYDKLISHENGFTFLLSPEKSAHFTQKLLKAALLCDHVDIG